uniref:uncharacterized protein n=1 Tax=Pristiophorus japonicus TaxID=55135 RepID=UPI00398E5B47
MAPEKFSWVFGSGAQRVVGIWNTLSQKAVDAGTIAIFKTEIGRVMFCKAVKGYGEKLDVLEEERRCRRAHWHLQRQKEGALFMALKGLLQEVFDTKAGCKFEKVEEKVTAIEDTIELLQDSAQSEAHRRHTEESHFASLMPTDVVLLVSRVDKEEAEQELLYLAVAQTSLEKVTQFIQKMRQDETRQKGRLQELQEGLDREAEEVSKLKYQQVKTLLTQEFQRDIMTRWTGLDTVYIRLEHLRDLAELCAEEAKGILFGGLYCFGDYQLMGSPAAGHFQGVPDSTSRKMLPLLKQLINLLEADRNIILSPDTLNLVSRKEQDWAKLLAQSPLYKLLQEINEHLRANPEAEEPSQAEDHQQDASQPEAKFQETGRPYIDIMDAQWTCEGNLVPLTVEKISVTELVVYRFGIFVVQLVKRSINAPEINLLLASSLPTNNYTRNAFRNSFFYQHSRQRLYIRQQRLASVGDFCLLLVHCLAHLTADELSDDSNPQFLKLFHQALKALFKDMFFTRLRIPPALHAHEPRALTWDNLFRKELYPETYTDAISDLLDVKLKDPKVLAFLAEHLQQSKETRNDNISGAPVKGQRAERLQGQSAMQNDGVSFESKSELDLEDIEEKMDNITVELTAIFESEQKGQESTVSVSKKRAFLKEIEELEAELASRKK